MVGSLLIAGVVIYLIIIFNRLTLYRNRYINAFAQIDVQLKRRYDLIPSLVETTKVYMEHERGTLEAITAARQHALTQLRHSDPHSPTTLHDLSRTENRLSHSLTQLIATMENYPQLKADTLTQQLMSELSSTENKIGFARQFYNDSVMEYNTYRQSFPHHLFASLFGHPSDGAMLAFENGIKIMPKVVLS